MTSDAVIERQGDGWFFRYDTSAAPQYVLLAIEGKPALARTEALLELLRSPSARVLLSDGRHCPIIIDQREQPPPSLDSLKSARALVEAMHRDISYLLFLVMPQRTRNSLMDLFVGTLERLMPGRYAFVTSMEEATAQVAAFYELGAGSADPAP